MITAEPLGNARLETMRVSTRPTAEDRSKSGRPVALPVDR
jgi:hypothetical protein